MRVEASLISCSVMSGPPVMLMSTPVAPSMVTSSSSGEEIACVAAADGASFAAGAAGAHERHALFAHDRPHVGEVDVDDAVLGDEVADALARR